MVEFGIIANPTKSGICSQIRVKIIELYGMTPELNKTLHNFFHLAMQSQTSFFALVIMKNW